MEDYGDALEPLQQLIKELTPDGAWLFGPEGKALAKLPSPGFAWQGGEPVAISTARVGRRGPRPRISAETSALAFLHY
jgi:hypothetical protein